MRFIFTCKIWVYYPVYFSKGQRSQFYTLKASKLFLQSGKCILLTENELKCMYKRDSICAVDKFSIIKIN